MSPEQPNRAPIPIENPGPQTLRGAIGSPNAPIYGANVGGGPIRNEATGEAGAAITTEQASEWGETTLHGLGVDAPAENGKTTEAAEIIDSVPWADKTERPQPAADTDDRMPTYGGYTGRRVSQLPGARWQPGMPVTGNMLTNPQQGDPNVPNLGPGDPRNSKQPSTDQK